MKKLSKKLVIFSFFYKLFFKNIVLIYALRAHVSKIQHTIQINHLIIKKKKTIYASNAIGQIPGFTAGPLGDPLHDLYRVRPLASFFFGSPYKGQKFCLVN